MFEKKLIALDYHSPNSFDYKDETAFRNFISWLENQKIRFYRVEDRVNLDQVDSDQWPNAYEKYLSDLNLNAQCDREIQIEKLLAHAIRLEYSDNAEKYNLINIAPLADEFSRQNSSSSNDQPLESIDYTSKEFIDGLKRLQKLLNVPNKQDDHTSVLQAISKLIVEKFNPQQIHDAAKSNAAVTSASAAAAGGVQQQSSVLTLDSINLGFDTNDKHLNEAAKILRLLHIKELRDLQTKINETIVAVQDVTANPKTDSSLGRVGK